MPRYIVTFTSATSTRTIVVPANGIIDARVRALSMRNKGEQIAHAAPFDPQITVN